MIEVLSLDNLIWSHNDTFLFDGLSFDLFQSEILGITGLNGSGRSTLANIISGGVQIPSLNLSINQKEFNPRNIQEAEQKGIYCIHDKGTFFKNISVAENIMLLNKSIKNTLWFPSKSQIALYKAIASDIEANIPSERNVSDISISDSHTLEILRAYLCGAKVIILDDVLKHYSENDFVDLIAIFKKLTNSKVSLIVIDSNIDRLCQFVNRVVVIGRGRKIAELFRGEFSVEIINKILLGAQYRIVNYEKNLCTNNKIFVFDTAQEKSDQFIRFSLHEGEVLGFSVKDSRSEQVLNILKGNQKVTNGRLLLHKNEVITGKGINSMQKQRIEYLTDYHKMIFPQMTAIQNLEIGSLNNYVHGLTIDKSFERFVWNETAEKIGIDPALYNTPIRKLSSLIQFQIVLSRALLMKPEIIVLDNCIEGLDVRLRNYIFEFIMEAKRRKIGILYFGQLTQLAYNICDVFAF